MSAAEMTVETSLGVASHTTREQLLETFDGDAEFVTELVLAFVDRCPLALAELRQAIADGDGGAIANTAHALKGTIGYFDDGAALEAAQRLERIGAAELPQAPAMVSALASCLTSLTHFLLQELPS